MVHLSSDLLSDNPDVARVAAAARQTFGTKEKAARWLERPTAALSGVSPLDLSATGTQGVEKVLDLLRRIDHGLAV